MSEMCAITGSSRLDHSVPALALVERDADAFFFTPNDMATPLELIARYKKRETVRDKQGGGYFERSAGFRDVANDAVNSTAAELNGSGLQCAATFCNPVMTHRAEIRPSS